MRLLRMSIQYSVPVCESQIGPSPSAAFASKRSSMCMSIITLFDDFYITPIGFWLSMNFNKRSLILDSLIKVSFNVTDDSRVGRIARHRFFTCVCFAHKLSSSWLGGSFLVFRALRLPDHGHPATYEKEFAHEGIFFQILWQTLLKNFSSLLFLPDHCRTFDNLADLHSLPSKLHADLFGSSLVRGRVCLRLFLCNGTIPTFQFARSFLVSVCGRAVLYFLAPTAFSCP